MDSSSQLQMFEDDDAVSLLKKELSLLHQRCELLKRGMASKYNHLAKLCLSLQEENGVLKKRIEELEKTLSDPCANPEEDDYLSKLFQEAYLSNQPD